MIDATEEFSNHQTFLVNNITTGMIPDCGVYFWWVNEDGLKRLGIPSSQNLYYIRHYQVKYYLSYIGIGPRDRNSNQLLPVRIMGKHLGKRIKDSTLRYAIASIFKYQFYRKLNRKGKFDYYTDSLSESKITSFLRKHFLISVLSDIEPWQMEKGLIQQYSPPLNIEHNKNGWYCTLIKQSRMNSRDNSLPIEIINL